MAVQAPIARRPPRSLPDKLQELMLVSVEDAKAIERFVDYALERAKRRPARPYPRSDSWSV